MLRITPDGTALSHTDFFSGLIEKQQRHCRDRLRRRAATRGGVPVAAAYSSCRGCPATRADAAAKPPAHLRPRVTTGSDERWVAGPIALRETARGWKRSNRARQADARGGRRVSAVTSRLSAVYAGDFTDRMQPFVHIASVAGARGRGRTGVTDAHTLEGGRHVWGPRRCAFRCDRCHGDWSTARAPCCDSRAGRCRRRQRGCKNRSSRKRLWSCGPSSVSKAFTTSPPHRPPVW